MTPIDPFTEEDLKYIESMDLDRDEVLNALAKVVGIRLSVARQPDDRARERWYATPRDAPDFKGSRLEVATFVKGYAYGYRGQRNVNKRMPDAISRVFAAELERQDYDLTKRGP